MEYVSDTQRRAVRLVKDVVRAALAVVVDAAAAAVVQFELETVFAVLMMAVSGFVLAAAVSELVGVPAAAAEPSWAQGAVLGH